MVIDAGAGVWSIQWSKIQRVLSADARICTYDRAGYGWSEPGTARRTAMQAAEELAELLARSGETGPYLLVGESYGGYVARLFADKHRSDVAGVVLVESAHEHQWVQLREAAAMLTEALGQLRIAVWLSRVGYFRWNPTDRGEDLPVDVRPALQASLARPQTYQAMRTEFEGAMASAGEVERTRSFGDAPLVVLSAGHSFDKFVAPAEREKVQGVNQRWLQLQEELAALSTNSHHIVIPNATHGIAREQPDVVISAIRKGLQLARDTVSGGFQPATRSQLRDRESQRNSEPRPPAVRTNETGTPLDARRAPPEPPGKPRSSAR